MKPCLTTELGGVSLYGEMHRFIPAILKIKGFKIGELEVNHRPRKAGETKYNWKRGVKGIFIESFLGANNIGAGGKVSVVEKLKIFDHCPVPAIFVALTLQ